jgi:glutathione synthase/RimK-type ligase-like ATP-grasp enzyme
MGIVLLYGLKTNDLSYLKGFYPSRRIAEAASSLGLDYAALLYPPESPVEPILAACQGRQALLRGELPMALYEALEAAGIRVVNSAASAALARDKCRSAAFFASLGLAHPRTVRFCLPDGARQAPEPSDAPQSPRAQGLIVPPLPLPFVAKPRYGKMGRGVSLIASEADWLAYARECDSGNVPAGEFLAQDYIAASRGRDIRFFFASWPNGRPWVCVQRQGQGFLSNAHAGGRMSAYKPPAGLAAEAERAFAASGLSYGSVDFLFADEKGLDFYIGELNGCPGFEELERSCGVDAATAIVKAAMI